MNSIFLNTLENNQFRNDFSEKMRSTVDTQIEKIVREQYERTRQILMDNKSKIEYLRNILMEKETVYSDDIEKIFNLSAVA